MRVVQSMADDCGPHAAGVHRTPVSAAAGASRRRRFHPPLAGCIANPVTRTRSRGSWDERQCVDTWSTETEICP